MRICKKCTRDIGTYLFCPYCGTNQSRSSMTLGQVYSDWSALYYRKIGKKTREGYENAWKTLRMLEHLEMLDITVHDYQAAMDKLTRKSKSLQHKLLLLIGQLCNYATEVYRMEVIKPSAYLVLDGIESKSREIFSDEEISRLFFYANQNEKFSCTAREVLLLVFTGLRPEEFFSILKDDINLEGCYIFSAGSKTGAGRNRIIPLIAQVIPYAIWFFYNSKGNYLFTSPQGRRVRIDNWRERRFYPLMRELGITQPDNPHRLVPYSCRHTYASLADRAEVDKDTLIKMIGHASYKFTKKTYIHENLPQFAAEVKKLERLVQNEMITKGNGKDGLSW